MTMQEPVASKEPKDLVRLKDFVRYIVQNLVDHPHQVHINEVAGKHSLVIELSVEKSDTGKVIGKHGKTIQAIRTILMSVASRNGLRVTLDILEDKEPKVAENAAE